MVVEAVQVAHQVLAHPAIAAQDDMAGDVVGYRAVLGDFHPGAQQATAEFAAVLQQGGGHRHGEYGDGHQQAGFTRRHDLMRHRQGNQHKPELATLGQNKAAACGGVGRFSQQAQQDENQHGLEQHQRDSSEDDPVPLFGEQVWVYQHADTDKEQAEQQIAEGAQVRFDLMAEVAFPQHHACQKGPQCHGEAQPVGDPGGDQRQQQGRHHKHFIGAGAAGFFQQPWQYPFSHHVNAGEQQQGFAQGDAGHGPQGVIIAVTDYRQHHQHDHRRQILKQQDAGGGPTVTGIDGAAADQVTNDDGGGGQGQRPGGDAGGHGLKAQQAHYCEYSGAGKNDLQRTGAEHNAAQGQ